MSEQLIFPSGLLGQRHAPGVADEETGDDGAHWKPARAIASGLSLAQRLALQDTMNAAPIVRLFGARIDASDDCVVRMLLDQVGPQHQGGMGTTAVSGMISSALLDGAFSAAAMLHFPQQRSGTMEVTTHFMQPLFGDRVEVLAVVIRRTPGVAFCEGRVLDARGRLCVAGKGIVTAARAPTRARGAA
jgi:uncharacterized protein (TIGR00369 family)